MRGVLLVLAALLLSLASRAEPVQYNRDVRPILSENCFTCHGPDAAERKAGLRLDEAEGAFAVLRGGARAIVPGEPAASELVRRISAAQPGAIMPPPETKKTLTPEEVALLARWIDEGAEYQPHWAFVPPTPQSPPKVKDEAWPHNGIDNFILNALEAHALAPNPEADRRTLIRRAYFDLLGMPPSPAAVAEFLQDEKPDAYDRLLDGLLASPQYGERWARHWLDVARFAESHGYEQDYDRPYAYHYRDFVIKALNQDLPYDEFVRWQLAGDEIDPRNPMAMAATGFLGAGTHATQITASQVEKERYDELDDMARTTSLAFLGLTVGCARCHDHKYDPIPAADYYRLASTFTTTVRADLDIDLDPQGYEKARKAFHEEHWPLQVALSAHEETLRERFPEWLKTDAATDPGPDWVTLNFDSTKSENEGNFFQREDASYFVSGRHGNHDAYTLQGAAPVTRITALRIEALRDPQLINGGPGRSDKGSFALSGVELKVLPAGEGEARTATFTTARASYTEEGTDPAGLLDTDNKTGWAVDGGTRKNHHLVLELEAPLEIAEGERLELVLPFRMRNVHTLGRFRVAVSQKAEAERTGGTLGGQRVLERLAQLRQASSDPSVPSDQSDQSDQTDRTDHRAALFSYYRQLDEKWRALHARVEAHAEEAPLPKLARMMVTSEGVPAIRTHTQGGDFLEHTHFLDRGDPNRKGEIATQGFVQALMRAPETHWQIDAPEDSPVSFKRYALAQWITDYDKGAGFLLARVAVNRLWQYHFGTGIVATSSDFGLQGAWPSHPELLDYLAAQLIANDWRLKPIHKLIMTSATYRQSAAWDEAKAEANFTNSLLWRYPSRRLEAESIRDSMLAVSGALDPALYGPGTLDPAHTRRSLYFMVKRSKLIPMMMLFDAPDTTQSLDRRATTTIAPQALLMMNNEQVRKWAEAFASRLQEAGEAAPDALIERAYQTALGRDPDATELTAASTFLAEQTTSYERAGQANSTALALTDFCQVLMGLNEFVYVP